MARYRSLESWVGFKSRMMVEARQLIIKLVRYYQKQV